MSYRLSVRLSDELARGVDSRARQWGATKSKVVREALKSAGLWVQAEPDPADLLDRAAAFRARQPEVVDAVALIREVRGSSALRLKLMRLTIPPFGADLA